MNLPFRPHLLLLVTICLLIAFFTSPAAHATFQKEQSLDELAAQANVIVKGTVTDLTCQWEEDETVIYTYVSVSVDEYIEGAGPSEVIVKQIGGIVKDIGLEIFGQPEFTSGEKVLLYLNLLSDGYYEVVNLSQGKFTIESDESELEVSKSDTSKIDLSDFMHQLSDEQSASNTESSEKPNIHSLLAIAVPLLLFLPSFFLGRVKYRSKHLKLLCLLFVGFLLSGSLTSVVSAFRPFAPNPGVAGDYLRSQPPTDLPPFIHWDLREFPNCKVPWSVAWPVPDLDGMGGANTPADQLIAKNTVWSAFEAWENVRPAVLGFVLGDFGGAIPPGPDGLPRRGVALDGYNLISWTGAGRDDVYNPALPAAQRVVGANVGANVVIILSGGNGFLETQPRGDDQINIAANNINAGSDGVIQTAPNNQIALPPNVNGLTGLFFDNRNGAIIEADILLNNWDPPNDARRWVIAVHGAPLVCDVDNPPIGNFPGNEDVDWDNDGVQEIEIDLQTVVMHEIGHFIGLGHRARGNSHNNPNNSLMEELWRFGPPLPLGGWANQVLKDDDMDGINFLYTPDLGDAPDPFVIPRVNKYPSLVHDPKLGRTLSGVKLDKQARGAVHLFGVFFDEDEEMVDRDGDGLPDYQYEWLGKADTGKIDDSPNECEALVTDLDKYDDGWVNYPPGPIRAGQPFIVKVRIRTTGRVGRYAGDDRVQGNTVVDGGNGRGETRAEGDDEQIVPIGGNVNAGQPVVGPGPDGKLDTAPNNAGHPLYLNVWFDWNPTDRDWLPNERLIWWEGGPGFTKAISPNRAKPEVWAGNDIELEFEVTPPLAALGEIWIRFRLDWAENTAGAGAISNVDSTLDGPKGAAQFGEVEDYKIHVCLPFTPLSQYFHADDGLIDRSRPVFTYWHGLCPEDVYGTRYRLCDWQDNCNDILSLCDYIKMENVETKELEWFHVENVTITLLVEKKPYYNETMYVEFEGYIQDFPWDYPVCTWWKEVFPVFCNSYHLLEWYDDNGDGSLSPSDQILFEKKCTGIIAEYHIAEIATDIILIPKTPPGPPCGGRSTFINLPANKPTSLTLWIPPFLLLVIVSTAALITTLRRRKRKSQEPIIIHYVEKPSKGRIQPHTCRTY